jgi:hypothetical protein
LSNYAAAKAGLYGLTKALAFEGAELGINVNAILPVARSINPDKEPIPDLDRYASRATHRASQLPPWRNEPSMVSARAAYLCSPGCDLSGEAYSAFMGRYARVFVAVSDGWIAPDEKSATAENLAGHFDEIRDVSRLSIPMWAYDEGRTVTARIFDEERQAGVYQNG